MTQTDSFVGEISLFAYNGIPQGWMECNGRALSRTGYSELYAVIGGKFGENPSADTFNLPNLAHSAIMGPGQGAGLTPRADGARCGQELVQLQSSQISHSHSLINKGAANPSVDKTRQPQPSSTIGAITVLDPGGGPPRGANSFITGGAPTTNMNPDTIGPSTHTNHIPHENRQPFVAFRFCICWKGEFPSPS